MAKEEKKRDIKLAHTRMKEAQFLRNLWVATVEQGVTRKDINEPQFWSHVAFQFRPYDRLEVRSDDGTFFAEFLILACERTYAKVKELSWVPLTSADVSMSQSEPDMFMYKYRGAHCKHSIIRKTDDMVMVEKMNTKEEALAWLSDHMKVI